MGIFEEILEQSEKNPSAIQEEPVTETSDIKESDSFADILSKSSSQTDIPTITEDPNDVTPSLAERFFPGPEASINRKIRQFRQIRRMMTLSSSANQIANNFTKAMMLGMKPEDIQEIVEYVNLPENQSGLASFGVRFFDILEKFQAPQFAIFNPIKTIAEGGTVTDAVQSFGRGLSVFLPDFATDPLGIEKERTTFADILSTKDAQGRPLVGELGSIDLPILGEVTGRGTIGLVGDILFDPLNLIGIGPLVKSARAARKITTLRNQQQLLSRFSKGNLSKKQADLLKQADNLNPHTNPLFKEASPEAFDRFLKNPDNINPLALEEQLFDEIKSIARTGERDLIQATFRGREIFAVKGQPIISLAKMMGTTQGGKAIRKAARTIFNKSKTGNDFLDDGVMMWNSILHHRTREGTQFGRHIGKMLESFGATVDNHNRFIDIFQKELSDTADDLILNKRNEQIDLALRDNPTLTQELSGITTKEEQFKKIESLSPELADNITSASEMVPFSISEQLQNIQNLPSEIYSQELKNTAKVFLTDFAAMAEEDIKARILDRTLKVYFPFLQSRKAAELLGDKTRTGVGFGNAEISTIYKSNLPRSSPNLTSYQEELENAARRAGKVVGGETLPQLFVSNPAIAASIRRVSSARARSRQEFLDFAADPSNEWVKLAEIDAQGRPVAHEGFREVKIDNDAFTRATGQKVLLDNDAADYIEKYMDKIGDAAEISEMGRQYRKAVGFWKAWTLGVYPAYHVRNEVGNIWNNWLDGVKFAPTRNNGITYKAGVYGIGRELQLERFKDTAGNTIKLKTQSGKLIDFETVKKAGERLGVDGSGIYGSELPEFYYDSLRAVGGDVPIMFNSLSTQKAMSLFGRQKDVADISIMGEKLGDTATKNFFLGIGFTLGRAIENNARWAHFVDRVIKDDSFLNAAKRVQRFNFDYTDLTKKEMKVRDNIIPFYTWSRKNIPLQIQGLMETPSKFTLVRKLKGGIEDDDVPNRQSLSEFIRENGAIRIRKNSAGDHEYFLLGNWLPAFDIEKIFGPPSKDNLTGLRATEEVLRMIFPGISRFAEFSTNFDFFRLRPIRQTLSDRVPVFTDKMTFLPEEVRDTLAKPNVARLAEIARPFGELNRLVEGFSDIGPGQAILRAMSGIRVFPIDMTQEQISRINQMVLQSRGAFRNQETKSLREIFR
jgi:hypothetical protein